MDQPNIHNAIEFLRKANAKSYGANFAQAYAESKKIDPLPNDIHYANPNDDPAIKEKKK